MRATCLLSAGVALVLVVAPARAEVGDPATSQRQLTAVARVVGPREREAAARLAAARPARERDEDSEESEENEEQENMRRSAVPPGAGTGESVVPPAGAQSVQAFGYAWAAALNFDGPTRVSYTPADPTIAVGPTKVVVAVNTEISIYSKDSLRVYDDTITNFLGGAMGATWKAWFDPRLGYDEASQRFYFVALSYDFNTRSSAFAIAVSQTNDPIGNWNVYKVRDELDGEGMDYPDIGFGPTGVYLCGNYLSFLDWASFPPAAVDHGNVVFTFSKSQLTSGAALTIWQTTDQVGQDNVLTWCQRPAQNYGPPPPGIDNVLCASQVRTSQTNRLTINVWGVTLPGDFPTHGPAFDRRGIDTDFPGRPLLAPQLGGAPTLQDTIQNFNLSNAQCRTRALVVTTNLGNAVRAFARVIGINIGSWPSLSVTWQADFDDGSHFTYFPAVTANNPGDVCVTYARSNASEYVGMHANLRPLDATVPAGDLTIQSGLSHFNVEGLAANRWGDYAGAATDPSNQGFWLFHMYPKTIAATSQWATKIAYIPRAVFVDGSSASGQNGSRLQPWHTIPLGQAGALSGNDLVVRAGTYAAGITLSTPMRVVPDGGTVQIGP